LIAEKFNKSFTGIAQDLFDKVPTSCKQFTTYLCPPTLVLCSLSYRYCSWRVTCTWSLLQEMHPFLWTWWY